MPFIWDDNKWLMLDEEDEYDKTRFVIVRKLFVTPKNFDVIDDSVEAVSNFSIFFIQKDI